MSEPRNLAERAQRHDTWLGAVTAEPYLYDFYQAMRRIASAHPQMPPLGEALRPVDEPVRLGQPAELDFAPASLHSLERRAGAPPRLMQRIFGLLGPNGALPLHLTEYARERSQHHGDPTFQRFLDTLTHRFALLFYRAWAEAQPAVSLDRSGNKAYFNRLGSLVGIGLPSLQDRDALSDASKVYFAGRLSRQIRDADGLLSWIRCEFDVPVTIEQWCGHWMTLMRSERSRLGRRDGAVIGQSAVLGGSVWDVQHKFRITMGPLTLPQYLGLLPGSADLARLQAMVRHWVGIELAWDLKLVLSRDEVPRFALGSTPVHGTAEPPGVPEGTQEVELVAVQQIDTDFGPRVALVFRVIDGVHRGAELTEIAVPNASSQGQLGKLLRALAGSDTASLAAAHELIGRRCRIVVRHERRRDGSVRPAIGGRGGLGLTTWLGRYQRARDADDLRIDVERPCPLI
jgi:type VI secretion system protein ImpH